MQVRDLIEALIRFDPYAKVTISAQIETHTYEIDEDGYELRSTKSAQKIVQPDIVTVSSGEVVITTTL